MSTKDQLKMVWREAKMCNTRNSRRITIGQRTFRVDGCIRDIINGLNNPDSEYVNIETLGCCCGHGRYPETIIIRADHGGVYEYHSGIEIPRTRRFYRKDTDGYYYIPEISKPTPSQNRLEIHKENTGSEIEKEEN